MGKVRFQNTNLDYNLEELTSKKSIISIYLDGQLKQKIKIWLGSFFGEGIEEICIAAGTRIDPHRDSSYNEILFLRTTYRACGLLL